MQAHKKADVARKRPLSILIADDDLVALLMLIMMLRDEGHIVHTCAGAKFVVEAVSRYQPDVCIVDIVMPGQVGFGIVPDNALARRFRDAQGRLNQRMAARADRAVLMVAGLPLVVKESP